MQMRTTKPTTGNKFYIRQAQGGYSLCIQGSPTDAACNVLSNCVGYACGRFNEIIGSMKYPALNCNAENFIERAQSLGLEISSTPSLGAIIVWQKGTLAAADGAGHVEVVERVDSDTQIYTSASNYGGTAFYNNTRKKVNGEWQTGWSGYTFRGFIKNPAITDGEEPDPGSETIQVGSKVTFGGGRVYASSSATTPAANRPLSECKVTIISNGAKHPYHLQSLDGKGVYGWVDAADVKQPTTIKLYATTISGANAGDTATIEALAKQLKLDYKTTELN